jgi:MFS family permease
MALAAVLQPVRIHARVLTASVVGTSIEYYDFFIYATAAALFFGPLFFPAQAPETQILLALTSSAIAYIARPLGAVAFGHIGDCIGRKPTLVASLFVMGGCTVTIAFLPTYAMVGAIAPVLLCLIRFVQGFAVGGEWAGAALLSIEHAPVGWRARFGVTAALGVWIGKGLGYAMFLILGLALAEPDMLAWGWRVPFLASAVIVLFGLWIRLRIAETPEFLAHTVRNQPARVPVGELIAKHTRTLLAGSVVAASAMAMATLADVFALAQASGPLGYDRNALLSLQLAAWPFGILSLLLGATYADLTSAERAVGLGALVSVPIGLAFGVGLGSGSLVGAGAAICLVKCAAAFTIAATAQWLSSLFPVHVRCTAIALAMSIAAIIGQAASPVLAQIISTSVGIAYVGLLPATLALLALAATRLARPAAVEAPCPA